MSPARAGSIPGPPVVQIRTLVALGSPAQPSPITRLKPNTHTADPDHSPMSQPDTPSSPPLNTASTPSQPSRHPPIFTPRPKLLHHTASSPSTMHPQRLFARLEPMPAREPVHWIRWSSPQHLALTLTLSAAWTAALESKSSRTTPSWPFDEADMSGVHPS